MKTSLIRVILLLFLVMLPVVGGTGAYFSDEVNSAGNNFATGYWVPPTTKVLALPEFENTVQFPVVFSAVDNSNGIDHVDVYYRRNGGSYIKYGSYQPGDIINFNSGTTGGDGSYDFYSIGFDKSTPANEETQPASPDASTIVDTTPPPEASLKIEGSYLKSIEEKITNGNFGDDLNGWVKAGEVARMSSDSFSDPVDGSVATTVTASESAWMVRLGNTGTLDGNYVWENRFGQNFAAGAKSLLVHYNFYSRDLAPFDDPGFFIRLNGEQIFNLSAEKVNPTGDILEVAKGTGWQDFYYDLSRFNDPLSLVIYGGNTWTKDYQSWVYVDKVTTYFISAPAHAWYYLSGEGSFEYRIDDGDWQSGDKFQIISGGTHKLEYRAKDEAGNLGPVKVVRVITDVTPPAAVSDLSVTSWSANTVDLSWTATGNDGSSGRAARYDLRYSVNEITADNFEQATAAAGLVAPKEHGQTENMTITGLNPGTKYYFALKVYDEAPNSSEISNVVSATTDIGDEANLGDVIINEIMWGGDQYIELYNTTERNINLTGLNLYSYSLSTDSYDDVGIDFSGKEILSHGYYLINSGLSLPTDALQLVLSSSSVGDIDVAWNKSVPSEGYADSFTGQYYSMERVSGTSDGTNPLSWYTTIDTASTNDYFGGVFDKRGTPGGPNRSENEPLAHQKNIMRSPRVVIINNGKSLDFVVKNISQFVKLNYEIQYDSDSGPQGVIGEVDLNGENEYKRVGITLGTCSTGGTCVYHQNVKNLIIKVILVDKDGKEITVNG